MVINDRLAPGTGHHPRKEFRWLPGDRILDLARRNIRSVLSATVEDK